MGKGLPMGESLTITKIDEKGYWSEDLFICSFEDSTRLKLVEKLIDKVEPKFKAGDWVVHDMSDGRKAIRQIVNMTNKSYILDGEYLILFISMTWKTTITFGLSKM